MTPTQKLLKWAKEESKRIKLSHSGWYESYASTSELELIKVVEQLEKETKP